ncbi:glycoside hydrolase [Coniochaeta ligniaria NRRL 30616]|uniref:Probable beta-glucosidase btgE n=1 Tax=Coniochaeta ligniaria NRRL 30616 TaxID=1408157 RepID=A0A1J7JYL1_9PEZI|nr:glycoside hydrolase [Coniochaeta ligniaria NRRL 30616]
MKAAFLAAAAAVLTGGASAGHVQHRHAHDLFKAGKRANDTSVCVPGCTTIYSTITGPAGLYTPPAAPSTSKPAAVVTTTTTTAPALVPTPIAQTCPTPGTYTFPATTVVVTETTTVCAASTTKVPSGTHTLGGVTTVVTTATTVVCPYATVKTEAGVVTSVIQTTTYVCPSAGTYTIAPITTVVATETVVVVPVVTTYCPGTYTAPAVITTITETDYVVYCPFTSPAPVAAPAPTTSAAPPPPPPPASTAAAATSAAPSSASVATIATSGNTLGITFTPYTTSGDCKSASDVLADITAIANAGITRVRVYSTDCDTLPNVGAAAAAVGIKMIVGIFIGEVGCDNGSPDVAEQLAALKAWTQWSLVDLVVVGNEALFNNFCTVSQLHDLIVHVKSELSGTGYTGPYTTTDVVSAWITGDLSPICSVIDVVGANVHAYFNGGTTPEQAGEFVAGQLKIVEDVCGLTGYILESGWPTQGKCLGSACAGKEEQKVALTSIMDTCGDKTVFFSFKDDDWKPPGDCLCEQHFGTAELFGA